MKHSKHRSSKGLVAIEDYRGRLRLRWSYAGKRYCLTLGLPINKLNVSVAQKKAAQIELDIALDTFDPTLQKYDPRRAIASSPTSEGSCAYGATTQVSCSRLFESFTEYKAQQVFVRTLIKYHPMPGYLNHFFGEKLADEISNQEARAFIAWLKERMALISVRERAYMLKAAWEWAIAQGMIKANPWKEAPQWVKVPPKQRPKPFTREEIGAILQAFRSDRHACHYADYVEFLLGTGVRTGEAIGLRWGHLSDDCSTVWIGESLTNGYRKMTKTGKARTIALTPKLQALLLARRPIQFDPEALVFTAPRGSPIDARNFRNRVWKPMLTRLEIDYRNPYNPRHTLISHALDLGMAPTTVAQLTGHDVQTLYENYAGNVASRPLLPEL
jgi:integrase